MTNTSQLQPVSVETALRAARDTRQLDLGPGALTRTVDVFRRQFAQQRAVIVADTNTMRVAGEVVAGVFAGAGHPCERPFIFPADGLYAEHSFVESLQAGLAAHDAIPVAVGSGTINDLAKLAAHRLQRPYMAVATAASVDGYTAYGASITYRGSKLTFVCPAPQAVVADVDVLRAAPPELTASGYADLLAKVPAGADWILADALELEPIHPQAWATVQGNLRDALSDPAGVHAGDAHAIERLTEGLMMGGFAMQAMQASRPASGAEHQFSHLWDMQHHTHDGHAPSHGFKVGIATLAVCRLYEILLEQPLEHMDVDAAVDRWPTWAQTERSIRTLFDIKELLEKALEESQAKHDDQDVLRAQLKQLQGIWPDLRQRLREQLLPAKAVAAMLKDAGAPSRPEQIGISRDKLRDSFVLAYHIRRRFTVLDLAVRTGLLDSCLASLFEEETKLHL